MVGEGVAEQAEVPEAAGLRPARRRGGHRPPPEASPLYRLKVEGAQALGLWEKVQHVGWGGLSAAESGRVGGYMTRMLKAERAAAGAPPEESPPAGGNCTAGG